MGWAAIIAALIQLLGPIIADWLKKCMESRLRRTANGPAPAESFANEGEAASALIDGVIASLPWYAYMRRSALRALKRVAITADGKVRTEPLTATEIAEARDLAAAIENE